MSSWRKEKMCVFHWWQGEVFPVFAAHISTLYLSSASWQMCILQVYGCFDIWMMAGASRRACWKGFVALRAIVLILAKLKVAHDKSGSI